MKGVQTMETEQKICPLSMSRPEDIPPRPCQKQRCAWWDEDSQDCAAVVLLIDKIKEERR